MAMNTALPSMIESIDISPSLGQWIVSGFSLVKGIMVPITAFAMTKYRTRNLFNLMLGLFSFGSFVTAIGFNFLTVVSGTIIQGIRSEEHTSELQSRFDLVCRLLLEKKKRVKTTKSKNK